MVYKLEMHVILLYSYHVISGTPLVGDLANVDVT